MATIVVQHGVMGLNSPKLTADYVITIQRGIYSRTGRSIGNVDEARGVRVTVWSRFGESIFGGRPSLAHETLFGAERRDSTVRNRMGELGAYVTDPPADEVIQAAVDRLRANLEKAA